MGEGDDGWSHDEGPQAFTTWWWRAPRQSRATIQEQYSLQCINLKQWPLMLYVWRQHTNWATIYCVCGANKIPIVLLLILGVK